MFICSFVPAYGQNNKALSMDGVDDYAVVQPFGNLNLGMQNFTMEASVLLKVKKRANDVHVILSNNKSRDGYIFGVNNDGTLFLTINNNTYSERSPINGAGVLDANCHSVAVKRDDEWIFFYIDGQLTTSIHAGPIQDVTTSSNIYIGINSNLSSSTALSGMLDDVRIWDIPRPDIDISMNSSTCLSGSETGLVAQWRFDHLAEPVIYDFSTNLHSGSLVSGGSNLGPQYLPFYCGMVCDDMDIRVTADPNCNQNINPIYCTQRNLICNGDFEQGAPNPGTNQNSFGNCSASGSSNEVTNWCSLFGTTWYFGRTGVPSNSIPTNRIVGGTNPRSIQCFQIDTWSGAPSNNRYAVFESANNISGTGAAGIGTSLINPLNPGTSYTLRFRALIVNDRNATSIATSAPLKLELRSTTNASTLLNIGPINITSGCQWQQYTVNFNSGANTNLDYFVVENAGIGNGQDCYYFMDEFELFDNSNGYPVIATGAGSQRPCQLDLDNSNNVYVAGYAQNTVTWSPSVITGTPLQGHGYLSSYDECGNLRWAVPNSTWKYKTVSYRPTNNLLYIGREAMGTTACNISTMDPANGTLIASVYNFPASVISIEKTIFDNTNQYLFIWTTNSSGVNQIYRYDCVSSSMIFKTILISSITDFDVINSNTICYIGLDPFPVVKAQTMNYSTAIPINTWTIQPSASGAYNDNYPSAIKVNANGDIAISGYYCSLPLDAAVNGTVTTAAMFPAVPTGVFFGFNYFAWATIINGTTGAFHSGINPYFGISDQCRIPTIGVSRNQDFIFNAYFNGQQTLATNLPIALNSYATQSLLTFKLGRNQTNPTWMTTALSTPQTYGAWPTGIKVGANNKIFTCGYLYSSINFLQGDVISSTGCDNTYVAELSDDNSSGTYLRVGDNTNVDFDTPTNGLIVKSIFNLKQELEIRKLELMELYNVNGQMASDKNLNYNLKDGLYMLRVRDDEGAIKSMKVIFSSNK